MLAHNNPQPVDPVRAVVIGAGGFLGTQLVTALSECGVGVVPVRRADVDLLEPDAGRRLVALLEPGDAIVILAALTPDRGKGTETLDANIRMVSAVCAAVAQVEPAHVVYVSSDAVYPLSLELITEESCASGPDLYGVMHRAREEMLRAATSVPLAIVRPTLVYGAADTHNSYGPNRLRRSAHERRRIELFGGGEERRDHISVKDVAALLRLTLVHRSAGILNLATGHSVSYLELAGKIARFVDDVHIDSLPRQVPVTHRHFDITALRRAFPTFVFTPLDVGLRDAHLEMLATS